MTEPMTLLPCPFCGGEAKFEPYRNDGLILRCTSLGCVKFRQRVMRHSTEWLQSKMTEHWNRRAHLAQQAQAVNVATIRSARALIDDVVHGEVDVQQGLSEAHDKLTRALSGEKAVRVGDEVLRRARDMVEGHYPNHREYQVAEALLRITGNLPASPTPDKEG